MISIKALEKRYDLGGQVIRALDGVTLQIAGGEYIAIMGASGSGKSTFMNIVGCLDTPSAGSYELDGAAVEHLDDDALSQIRNAKLGFVFQHFNLLQRMTVRENVEVPLRYAGVAAAERRTRATAALERVGIAALASRLPQELSGGQQQRVAIARAIVNHPILLLADEPTGALDSVTTREILDLFHELNHKEGMTLMMVTHDPDVAAQANRLVRFRDGRVMADERQASVWAS